MFLKKYWKSNLFFIFLFTVFDVYINNYPMSIYKNMLNDYFWINVFSYIFIYLVFTFIIDFVIFLFNRFFN
ncbi:hypothetical protein A9296_03215 [Haemophilus parainfluenzae]|nr:hypothetical protein A9296_03215 [Haemophilus parainfluenzae]OHR65209.1 hypothetical protein HMPREF3263_08100 [Haemophilus sp. HMSC61B11]